MTGETEALVFMGIGDLILSLVMAAVLIIIVAYVLDKRKSQIYRKTLMDMYVAAKIKFLAKEDGLSIEDEFESFKMWKKKQNLNEKDLDNVIEGELKERVAEEKLKVKKVTENKPKK